MEPYYEFKTQDDDTFDPRAVVEECIENGTASLLFDHGALPPEFFDLSSGVAGELLHRLSVYKMQMAAVVTDPPAHSPRFQEFMQEANRGNQYRFFPNRQEAIQWLERD